MTIAQRIYKILWIFAYYEDGKKEFDFNRFITNDVNKTWELKKFIVKYYNKAGNK